MAIGLTLLSTVVLPSLVLMVFHTSSMAAGLLLILGLYICMFLALSVIGRKFQSLGAGAILIAVVVGVIMFQSTISWLAHDDFDFKRFSETYLFLIIFLLGAFSFALLAQKVPKFQTNFAVMLVFYVLLLSSIAAILNFAPFSSGQSKPVFFFIEPSHFALNFLPFLLYITVTSSPKMKLLLLLLAYAIAILLESMTLIVGVTLVVGLAIPLRRVLFFAPIAVILILLTALNFDYYLSRVDISSGNQNLTTLVYLSGWERAYLNFKATFGLGVGFQQFGIIGSIGEKMEALDVLGVENLNLLDGGAVAPKFIGEFGLLAVLILLAYLGYFVKSAKWLREVSVGEVAPLAYLKVFFVSCFVMYSIDLFVRGTGYFSSSGFLFISSLMWIILVKSTNECALKIPDAAKTEP